MYKSFLIKYAEIAIKGKNRYLFEDALVSQINHALKKADGDFLVRKEQGRIYVDTLSDYDYDEVVEALKCVFGIVGICPVVLLEDEGFDKLAEEVISYIDKVYPDKHFTFKVNARRARKKLSDGVHGDQCSYGREDFRCLPGDESRCASSTGGI